jgi:hypothetical protein
MIITAEAQRTQRKQKTFTAKDAKDAKKKFQVRPIAVFAKTGIHEHGISIPNGFTSAR